MMRNKKILNGLDQNTYEHPFDHEALDRWEALPFLTKASKWITENTIEI